jgi:hypothetical protein
MLPVRWVQLLFPVLTMVAAPPLTSVETHPAPAPSSALYDLLRETPLFPAAQVPIVLSSEDELVRGLRMILRADFNRVPITDRPVPASTRPPAPTCTSPNESGVVRIKDGFAEALSPQPAPNIAILDVVLYDCSGIQRVRIRVQHDDAPKGKEDANAVLKDALDSNVQRALGELVLQLASPNR